MNTYPPLVIVRDPFRNFIMSIAYMMAFFLVLVGSCPGIANDEASGVAAGGVVPRQEQRISIKKERLTIKNSGEYSCCTIEVEYEFLNESNEDVTTVVAFPMPEYYFALVGPPGEFRDFKVWINGRDQKYQTEFRAMVNGKDYTETLTSLGIRVSTFGDATPEHWPSGYQIEKLSWDEQEKLIRMGLIDKRDNNLWPLWALRKKHFWTQTFPANQVVRISHLYTALDGNKQIRLPKKSKTEFWNEFKELPDGCFEGNLLISLNRKLESALKSAENLWIYCSWVKYILTSANTWKTPIKEFELIVEKPRSKKIHPSYISFCWDGKVEKVENNRFIARKQDFVPTQELTVYFFWDMFMD
jgi:hypothetical protein